MTNLTIDDTCVDCQSNPSSIEIRKRRLCQTCFTKYISSKILKRMETYRFKNQTGSGANAKKRLLLPTSGSTSSLVLLEVLDRQIKKQLAQQSRAAYELVICHIDTGVLTAGDEHDSKVQGSSWWEQLQQIFPKHSFLPQFSLTDACHYDDHIEADLQLLNLNKQENESGNAFIARSLNSARTPTARADLHNIVLQRMVVRIAKQQTCHGILWGHSDTTLAARALASVAKGRGGAIPNELADGPSPFGVNFNYPLRDLSHAELEMYVGCLSENMQSCQNPVKDGDSEPPVSLRATSIDYLLNTYITGQGEKYPSIMANVVRTASKLQVPSVGESRRCKLCSMPIAVSSDGEMLCYGCERMKQDIRI